MKVCDTRLVLKSLSKILFSRTIKKWLSILFEIKNTPQNIDLWKSLQRFVSWAHLLTSFFNRREDFRALAFKKLTFFSTKSSTDIRERVSKTLNQIWNPTKHNYPRLKNNVFTLVNAKKWYDTRETFNVRKALPLTRKKQLVCQLIVSCSVLVLTLSTHFF